VRLKFLTVEQASLLRVLGKPLLGEQSFGGTIVARSHLHSRSRVFRKIAHLGRLLAAVGEWLCDNEFGCLDFRLSGNIRMRSSTLLLRHATLVLALSSLCLPSDSFALPTFSEQGATILGGVNYSARSASLADIDNDGDLDLFFQGVLGAQQLFRNNLIGGGSFTYTNVSNLLPASLGDSWSAAWGDYDGDGRIDVFVGQSNQNASGDVLHNNGALGFLNASVSTGLNDPGFHQNVGWVDIDNDRDLDLIIGMEGPEKHEIYLQGPAGQFTPVGAATGFQAAFGTKSYGMAIGDSDGDGDLDVYISTCRGGGNIRNNFFKNMLVETGSLSFVDIADSNGTQNLNNTYGSEFVDFDDDGDLDLYVTGADGNETKIFRNDGNNIFTDVDSITGHELLRDVNGTPVRGNDLNGSKAVDYDNDGDLDLYFHDNLASSGNQRLFRNDGNWQFTDVTALEGLNVAANGDPVGAGGYDSTWGDLDLDGDQDLIDTNNSTFGGVTPTPERVYVSDASENGNHWLYVELEGPSYDTTGIGSSLYATVNLDTPEEVTLRREANTNIGTFNQSDLPVHFGLGAAALVDELLIQWPDGTKQGLHDVAANQYVTVRYLPGDYNGDGVVDAADYTVWRNRLGSTYKMSDYAVWREHFGEALPGNGAGASGAVPEPATTSLLLVALAALSRLRRPTPTSYPIA
jgi:ASPIC and UnbV/FG-GAP-like repeat